MPPITPTQAKAFGTFLEAHPTVKRTGELALAGVSLPAYLTYKMKAVVPGVVFGIAANMLLSLMVVDHKTKPLEMYASNNVVISQKKTYQQMPLAIDKNREIARFLGLAITNFCVYDALLKNTQLDKTAVTIATKVNSVPVNAEYVLPALLRDPSEIDLSKADSVNVFASGNVVSAPSALRAYNSLCSDVLAEEVRHWQVQSTENQTHKNNLSKLEQVVKQ